MVADREALHKVAVSHIVHAQQRRIIAVSTARIKVEQAVAHLVGRAHSRIVGAEDAAKLRLLRQPVAKIQSSGRIAIKVIRKFADRVVLLHIRRVVEAIGQASADSPNPMIRLERAAIIRCGEMRRAALRITVAREELNHSTGSLGAKQRALGTSNYLDAVNIACQDSREVEGAAGIVQRHAIEHDQRAVAWRAARKHGRRSAMAARLCHLQAGHLAKNGGQFGILPLRQIR